MAIDRHRIRGGRGLGVYVPALVATSWLCACAPRAADIGARTDEPAEEPKPEVVYDTTLPKPAPPRDLLERWAQERGPDFRLVDKFVDPRTPVPAFDREPLPSSAPDAQISADVPALNDTNPFPPRVELGPQEVTLLIGIAHSSYRTREPQEVLAAAGPLLDLVQRDVATRGAPVLLETPQDIYFALLDGRVQLQISHVFDYLLVREWFQSVPDNGAILLCRATPAHPYTTSLDRDTPGVPGTGIVLVIAQEAPYKTPADLKGTRLALAANFVDAPGAFLTRMLTDLGHPLDQPFFRRVTLRRYLKDAVIDLLKGQADVACVDEGTLGTLVRFYGLEQRLRPLAVSPHYNLDVIYTSVNNLATHRTEIELTQRQLTTLAKNAEGQEVLFLLDEAAWYNYREGDIDLAREHFADFVTFLEQTPADLKPLLDPNAPIDRRTYDRYGDE
jgi:hypothetical protein